MKIFISIFLILFTNSVFSQYILNPSFEGIPAPSSIPDNWSVCDIYSTPNIDPSEGEPDGQASDGETYITLLSRGESYPYANHCEDIQTHLRQHLFKGSCYSLSIDLKNCSTYGHYSWGEWLSFAEPVVFKIIGGSSSCEETELFVETEAITNTEWQTYNFAVSPTITDIDYLILKVDYASLPIYSGNLQLDNIKLINLGKDTTKLITTIDYGDEIKLNASEGEQYNWEPDIGLDCSDCQIPTAAVPYSITYTAYITQNVCEYKEKFIINVNPFLPNTLTPNGDGKNDVFYIDALPENSSLTIIDRHGNTLYVSDNYDNNWDGKYNGSVLPADTYWYSLKLPPNNELITGFIYIMY